jgi:hypothetical protein
MRRATLTRKYWSLKVDFSAGCLCLPQLNAFQVQKVLLRRAYCIRIRASHDQLGGFSPPIFFGRLFLHIST